MPNLADKALCSGCGACYLTCSRGAIALRPNSEGFVFPTVNPALCVECGRCEKVCPINTKHKDARPMACYAAYTKDVELRKVSSSGGVFSELAKLVFDCGGCVFGCVFDPETLDVRHAKVQKASELTLMRGSKYVQSNLGDIFCEVKKECIKGRKVLFSGTPCQISGLKSFLGKDYDNLLTIGLICHGVPSRELLMKRLRAISCGNGNLEALTFRSKRIEWRRFSFEVVYKSGQKYAEEQSRDVFMRLFNGDVAHRLSCYNCASRSGRSGADILIGDFWGVEYELPEMDYKGGVSAVLLYSPKGAAVFSRLDLVSQEVPFSSIARYNKNIQNDPILTWRRKWFYQLLKWLPIGLLCVLVDMTHFRYWKWVAYRTCKPVIALLRRCS